MDESTENSKQKLAQNQQPVYEDLNSLSEVLEKLSLSKVFTGVAEIESLKRSLSKTSTGNNFVIQAGDCVERFDFMNQRHVLPRLDLLTKMGKQWKSLSGASPVLVARMGGQLFKPRSSQTEPSIWGPIASFRGEAIHSYKKDHEARTPDPNRLLKAYELIAETCKLKDEHSPDIFFSHEALHLDWETALLREGSGKKFLGSAPFVWVGERTRKVDGPHIKLLQTVENVVGVKIGPSATSHDLLQYCQLLNPRNEMGKLVFILRLGLKGSADDLQKLLSDFQTNFADKNVVWMVDPMHGNKHANSSGQKYRSFFEILTEIRLHATGHRNIGSQLCGIHLESTPESVSEVLGGAKISRGVRQEQLVEGFDSYCDPRLNKHQCLELVETLSAWCSSHYGRS